MTFRTLHHSYVVRATFVQLIMIFIIWEQEKSAKEIYQPFKFGHLQFIGKTAGFAVPLLLLLLVLIGFFAASGYNSGATAVLQP